MIIPTRHTKFKGSWWKLAVLSRGRRSDVLICQGLLCSLILLGPISRLNGGLFLALPWGLQLLSAHLNFPRMSLLLKLKGSLMLGISGSPAGRNRECLSSSSSNRKDDARRNKGIFTEIVWWARCWCAKSWVWWHLRSCEYWNISIASSRWIVSLGARNMLLMSYSQRGITAGFIFSLRSLSISEVGGDDTSVRHHRGCPKNETAHLYPLMYIVGMIPIWKRDVLQ